MVNILSIEYQICNRCKPRIYLCCFVHGHMVLFFPSRQDDDDDDYRKFALFSDQIWKVINQSPFICELDSCPSSTIFLVLCWPSVVLGFFVYHRHINICSLSEVKNWFVGYIYIYGAIHLRYYLIIQLNQPENQQLF